MSQTLYYSSTSVAMTLGAAIGASDTTITLNSTTGLPASFPFKLLIDWGDPSQEVVYCTALAGPTATIQRGKDGSTAQAHAINASVIHGVSAEEYNAPNLHAASSAGVHGLVGTVVGTSDAQTLTNKTAAAANATTNALIVKAASGQSVDIMEWQDSVGTVLASVGSTGTLTATTSALSRLQGQRGDFTINAFAEVEWDGIGAVASMLSNTQGSPFLVAISARSTAATPDFQPAAALYLFQMYRDANTTSVAVPTAPFATVQASGTSPFTGSSSPTTGVNLTCETTDGTNIRLFISNNYGNPVTVTTQVYYLSAT